MALFFKKNRSKAAKLAGAALFVLLMFVNLQITTNPNKSGDLDLLGIKISLFTQTAYAYGHDPFCNQSCYWRQDLGDCATWGGTYYCLFECGYPGDGTCYYNN